MEKLKIRGARRLVGEVRVSGAKNAALPILAASLLTAGDLELKNVPDLADVRTMLKLLAARMNSSFFSISQIQVLVPPTSCRQAD